MRVLQGARTVLMAIRSCVVCKGRYDRRVMIALETECAPRTGRHDEMTRRNGRGRRAYVCDRSECAESEELARRARHALGAAAPASGLVMTRHDRTRAEGTGGDHLG
ncbi:MAG: DUF448 domain-containing protein [Armatimonadia bacterium]|nr:DUF448 domain-containing protein [Armatimonadia bacterium]